MTDNNTPKLIVCHIETSSGPRFSIHPDEEHLRGELIAYYNEAHADEDENPALDADTVIEDVIEAIEEHENLSREEMWIDPKTFWPGLFEAPASTEAAAPATPTPVHRHFQRVTKPFVVGNTYRTQGGKEVTCLELHDHPHYESARFDDPVTDAGGWRYNRDSDRGRVTGTDHSWSDPRNVIPEFETGDDFEANPDAYDAKAAILKPNDPLREG